MRLKVGQFVASYVSQIPNAARFSRPCLNLSRKKIVNLAILLFMCDELAQCRLKCKYVTRYQGNNPGHFFHFNFVYRPPFCFALSIRAFSRGFAQVSFCSRNKGKQTIGWRGNVGRIRNLKGLKFKQFCTIIELLRYQCLILKRNS
jgi:hypothetical protein